MKIAIVEIRESHEECIYTQLRFLKDAGHQVTLVIHPLLSQQISGYTNLADHVRYFDFESQGVFQKLRLQWRVYHFLENFDKVVFNTAHSYSVLRNLSVLMRLVRTECIGILHDTKKLDASFTQRIISQKVKKYFVLNDALLPKIPPKENIQLQSFYPIFFPDYKPVTLDKKNYIWIGIPGRMDYGRKDYDFLVDSLAKIDTLDHIKFIILGKVNRGNEAGARFYESLEKKGQSERFKLFTSFVANDEFHSYIKACDYIMPLLPPNNSYLKHKISGAFNLAFGYKKPLLCHEFFRAVPDLESNSLFYNADTFAQLIKDIDSRSVQLPEIYTDSKWDYRVQQKRYIDFIDR